MPLQVEIPQVYQDAISAAIHNNNVVLSKLRIRHVLSELAEPDKDAIAVSFYLREYKRRNKRQSKTTTLVNSVQLVIELLGPESQEAQRLQCAVDEFNAKQIDNGDEF